MARLVMPKPSPKPMAVMIAPVRVPASNGMARTAAALAAKTAAAMVVTRRCQRGSEDESSDDGQDAEHPVMAATVAGGRPPNRLPHQPAADAAVDQACRALRLPASSDGCGMS
ncbi:hypothetical protein [Micromonospora zamorensis]|uniref:hypothetical protein n=1 Tax=Micromonospora zamorensis TaxID=709883 RepID=UPI003CFAECA9